jgi:hypothetical protein
MTVDKVCHNFLQAETEADAQRRNQPLQIGPFNSERM